MNCILGARARQVISNVSSKKASLAACQVGKSSQVGTVSTFCWTLHMPRMARVVSGVPHHVTQRGNSRQFVFFISEAIGLWRDWRRR